MLREEDILRAVDALDKAKRVDFYGAGTSALVALDAQQKFQRLCRDTQTSTDPHVQVVIASRLERGDAAVFFSYSGETEDMLDTLAVAKRGGAVTISVTRYGVNRLSPVSYTHLDVYKRQGIPGEDGAEHIFSYRSRTAIGMRPWHMNDPINVFPCPRHCEMCIRDRNRYWDGWRAF